MKDEHDPLRLDVRRIATQGGHLDGAWPLGQMARLLDSLAEPPAAGDLATWAIRTEVSKPRPGAEPEIRMQLTARAQVMVQCQRCLEALPCALRVDRSLHFVEGEDKAAALDADSEDDVLPLAPRLDLRLLVEDELLMALPIAPRHADCRTPQPPADTEPADEDDRRAPFAVLGRLKKPPA